ncbi:MAG: type II secretion system F family protein [Candidatus Omnitrophota bacterium]|nr:type II secretion system F family protein [Candidatus Omnitrophota bacterium]
MPVFFYKVRDKAGRVLQGQLDAVDGKELRRKLVEREYFIIDYFERKEREKFRLSGLFSVSPRVRLIDIAVFSWQLYTLLDAGLPLVTSLKVLIVQAKNERFKYVLSTVCQRVEEGSTFSDALKEHPRIFSRLYVQMVNAGEVGGVLGEMINRLAIFYERQAEIRSKLFSAMIYPSMLLTVSLVVILFLVAVVLPQFAIIFRDIGVPIPGPTRFLLSLSSLITGYWFLAAGAVLGAAGVLRILVSSEKGKYHFHLFQLNVPVVGDLLKKDVSVRFTQTLATLAGSGIPILTALDVVTDTIGNKAVVKALKAVSVSVEQGKPMTQPMEESGLFPEMVVNMIRVGEETGSLEKMLNKIAEFYYKEVNAAIDAFTKLIEPILMVTMALIIGYIAIAIFLPMASLLQNIR